MRPPLPLMLALAALFSAARADTLPGVPESCFSYTLDGARTAPRGLSAARLAARLGSGTTLSAGPVAADGADGAALRDFNAIAAYAALTAFRGGTDSACRDHGIQTVLDRIQGRPSVSWSRTRLSRSGDVLTISRVTVSAVSARAEPRIRIEADGLRDSSRALVPTMLRADLSAHALDTPFQQITINALRAVSGDTALEGKGRVTIGESLAGSAADTHFSVTHVGGLIEKLRPYAPAKIMAMLALAQFMGRRNGEATEWDVTLEQGVATVNRVPIPLGLR